MLLFLFQYFSKYIVKGTIWSWPSFLSVIIGINLLYFTPCDCVAIAYCDEGCHNGDCVPSSKSGIEGEKVYKCECWDGWRGEKCEFCGGKVKLKENGGQTWLAEAVGNYSINMKCTWVVEAKRPESR